MLNAFVKNVVDLLEFGYRSVLNRTPTGKNLDDMLKDIEDILRSTHTLLKHYESLLCPEDYAKYTAKHSRYFLDVAEEIVYHETSPNRPIRQSRDLAQACLDKESRRARVQALYRVTRELRNQVLHSTQQAISHDIYILEGDELGSDLTNPPLTSLPLNGRQSMVTLDNNPPGVSWDYPINKPSFVGPGSKTYHQSITFGDLNNGLTVSMEMKAFRRGAMKKCEAAQPYSIQAGNSKQISGS
ncbi:hypothetical protein FRC07_008559 [Ceratobasidium sp. 392]|nr:hypothetical protein FRC07_008559 [Ceratobasidium sp. 392]